MGDIIHNLTGILGRFIRFIGRQLRRLGVWWLGKFRAAERNGKIALVLVPLLSVCCLSVLFIPSGVEPTPAPTAAAAIAQETAVPTATDEPTAVPPTRTPAPTETPAPTDTAVPTRTPRPTGTPEPEALDGFTAEETEYVTAVSEITLSYSEALNALGQLLTAAGDDESLVLDEDWRIQTVAATLLLNLNGDQVRGLEPPPRFATLHNHLLDAADEYDTSATLLLEGIDEGSVAKIDGAVAAMLAGNEAVNRATAEASNIQTAVAVPTGVPATAVPTNPPAQPTSPPATAVPTNPPQPTAVPTQPPAPTTAPPADTAVPQPTDEVAPTEPPPATGCVNLNTASFEELQQIIHIGPDRAQQIIDLRPWTSIQQMIRIRGIGPARLSDIIAQGVACV